MNFTLTLVPNTHWSEWNLERDIFGKLSFNELKQAREFFWCADGFNSPRVFTFLGKSNANAVFFAMIIANSPAYFRLRDCVGNTILHEITRCGSAALCSVAVQNNPTCVDATNNCGDNPYHIAAQRGDDRIMRVLCGIYPDDSKIFNTFTTFYLPPFQELPGRGINERNAEGWAPIHITTSYFDSAPHRGCIVEMNCHEGFDMDTRRGGDGSSALHIAVGNDDKKCVKTLVERGASYTQRNYRGISAFQLSIDGTTTSNSCEKIFRKDDDNEYLEEQALELSSKMYHIDGVKDSESSRIPELLHR